ncbi:MAG: hypothetical protein K0R09_2891 [Clostridiales bacterium]|jgi:uncharacterized membrane protein|nr:hypothetical protein [Clostridiales bacterium]
MRKRKFQLSLLALLFITSICISPFLQSRLPIGWIFDGKADRYGSKYELLFLMPLIASMLYSMSIPFEKNLVKKSQRSKNFIEFMQIYLIFILGSIHIYSILNALNYSISIYSILSLPTSIAYFYAGYSIRYIELSKLPNVKIKLLLSSDEVLHRVSMLSSNLLYACGVFMILGFRLPELFYFLLIVPLILSTIILIIYSYFLYKKSKNHSNM